MEGFTGARNTAGFSAIVHKKHLPPPTHLSYEGLFNELRFNVGPKTDKVVDLHHDYARFQFKESKFDSDIHDYLTLFVKGKADGQPREEGRRLNSVICLDISGSMNGGLGSNYYAKGEKHTRLSLCIEAIKMFISKLHPEDSVGMTTFDSQAHLIFEPILKKDLPQSVYETLDAIKACGGNYLIDGFNLSKSMLLKQAAKLEWKDCENRVIVLSDACDSSIEQGVEVIKAAAEEENVHLSIVGIST